MWGLVADFVEENCGHIPHDINPALLNEFLILNAFAILIGTAIHGTGRLPVVEREDEKKVVGFITRSDIINAHRKIMEEEGLAAPSKGS